MVDMHTTSLEAQKKCEEHGYKYKIAFYFYGKVPKLYLTDYFCSNEEKTKEIVDAARAVIMRDRKTSGDFLSPSSQLHLKQTEDLQIEGYKTTDLGQKIK